MVSCEGVVNARFQRLSQNQPWLHTPRTPAPRQGLEFTISLSYRARCANSLELTNAPLKISINEAQSIVPCPCPLPQIEQVKQFMAACGNDCCLMAPHFSSSEGTVHSMWTSLPVSGPCVLTFRNVLSGLCSLTELHWLLAVDLTLSTNTSCQNSPESHWEGSVSLMT